MTVEIKGLAVQGLNPRDDHDLSGNDTPPNAINIWFDVDDVYLPLVTDDEGNVKREEGWEKRVFFNFEYDMGFCAGRQKLRDKVKLNETTGKWEILKLAPGDQSHIRRYPEQWNAFFEGLNYNEIGTPLEVIFPRDKGYIKHLNKIGIFTVERLAAITEGEAQLGGMGTLDAKRKAMGYLERMKESRGAREINAQAEAFEKYKLHADQQIQELQNTVARLLAEKSTSETHEVKSQKKKQKSDSLVEA